jgi:pSer/pThr/pTyr-binding forkhead associated (FHA) protein
MSAPIVLALRVLMALALYGFLGWAIFLLWKEIHQQGAQLANRRVPGISLAVSQGQEQGVMKYFSQPEITLGRDPGCDIVLSGDTVSTQHAQLAYHHNQWWLTDLDSTNGTYLNGALVTMPTVITSGDEFKCGAAHLTVSFSTETSLTPTRRLEKKHD